MDGREETDRLIRSIQAGQATEQDFGRLFQRYGKPVLQFFVNRGFSVNEADDQSQEVFLKVFRQIDTFRFESPFEHWLFRIVKNQWINALRGLGAQKRSMELRFSEMGGNGGEESSAPGFEPEDTRRSTLDRLLSDEKRQLFLDACRELPPQMARCVLLRVVQELKYREIADILGVSISTVKSQLHAAKERLRDVLGTSGYPFLEGLD